MVSNTRDRNIDSSRREDSRKGKVDRCEVISVRPHVKPYPTDKDFNTVDVQLIDRPRIDGQAMTIRYVKLNSLQRWHGQLQGSPWNARIGDMIYVYWLSEREALVLGTCTSIEQEPVCRSCANDKHQERVEKLCVWEEPGKNDDGNYTIFPKPKHPICTKWWPVCQDGETIRRDWLQVWDCKNGHDRPECDQQAPCNKPDDIKQRTWWKYLSDVSDTSIDLPWRVKFHHNSESVFLFDNDKTIHLANKKSCTTCGGSGCDGTCPTCSGTKLVEGELCSTCGGTGCDVCATCNGDGCTEELGHQHFYPEGTNDLHAGGTQPNKDFIPLATENSGVRVSVVHPDDDSVDFAFEAIDFETGAYIRIMKTGDIHGYSPGTITWEAKNSIILDAPTVTETQDNIVSANNTIGGSCAHGACSCPCSGASAGSLADVAAAIQALQETAATEASAASATEGACTADGAVCTAGGSACCSGSSGSASMDAAIDSQCTIDGEMVFSENSSLTAGEISASDAAALEAASFCWDNIPVTSGGDWLGCI